VIVHSWLDLRSVLDDACVLVIVHSWLDLRSVLDENEQSQGHMYH
jgi:hypothetical protein